MKKLLALCFAALFVLGCESDHISDRVWLGSIYPLPSEGDVTPITDANKLSDVFFKLEGKKLTILSNAIFGSDNETLLLKKHRRNNYVFESSSGRLFEMRMDYNHNETDDTEQLNVVGPDYAILLSPVTDDELSDEMLSFYISVPAPPVAAYCFKGCWKGNIERLSDDRILSPVVLDYDGGVLHVYSNAIFGKANETLQYLGFSNGIFRYVSETGEEFYWNPEVLDHGVVFTSDDFRMTLFPYEGSPETAHSFYRGRNVARNADGYMFGTYKGKSVWRAVAANTYALLSGQSDGMYDMECTVTITFLEDNRCKVRTDARFLSSEMNMLMALFGGGTNYTEEEVYGYQVRGDKLIIGKDDQYIIRSDGSLFQSVEQVIQKRNGKLLGNDLILRRVN